MRQAKRQREAVELIQKLGGFYYYDYEVYHESVVSQPPGPAWLQKLFGRDFLFDVTSVYVYGETTDDDLRDVVKNLPSLEVLYFNGTQVSV